MKRLTPAFLVLAMAACASGPGGGRAARVSGAPGTPSYAEALVKRGHYRAFKEAFALYRDLYSRHSLRRRVAADYARTGILLALRERRLGIDNPSTLAEVNGIIVKDRSLSGFAGPALVVSSIPLDTRGVMKDISLDKMDQGFLDRLRAARDEIRSKARTGELCAAVLTAWTCSSGRFSRDYQDPSEFIKAHADSLPVRYEAALCGEPAPSFFEEVLARDPEFVEAHYHLGQAALAEKRLFEAERRLLWAYEAVPGSPQPPILLAGIYLATEEYESAIRFCDHALKVVPGYRDALLGKAISLASLGKHEESIAVLDRTLELGFWLIGESHYWLAWNLEALERRAEALSHIDEAKSRLPTNPLVFSLAGKIASALGALERAENDYRAALAIDPANTDAQFGLGALYTSQARWPEAANAFEKASLGFDAEAKALEAAIEDLEKADLASERKARLSRRRTARLARARLEGATASYNAAAAFFNAGDGEKARDSAERAAGHPAFKDKAEGLLRSIRPPAWTRAPLARAADLHIMGGYHGPDRPRASRDHEFVGRSPQDE